MSRPDSKPADPTLAPWLITAGEMVVRLEELRGLPAVDGRELARRIQCVKAQHVLLAELEDSPLRPLTPAACRGKTPWVGGRDLGYDLALAIRLFGRVVAACRSGGYGDEELVRLEQAIRDRPRLLEGFVRHAAVPLDAPFPPSLAQRLGVSAGVLLVVGRLVAAPFVCHALKQMRRHPDTAEQETGANCPYCGATAAMATVDEEGGRGWLHCSLCAAVWKRVEAGCPFCSARCHTATIRLHLPGSSERWIEAHPRCGNYLRCTGLNTLCASVPLVEELVGGPLDDFALSQGLRAKPPYAAMW